MPLRGLRRGQHGGAPRTAELRTALRCAYDLQRPAMWQPSHRVCTPSPPWARARASCRSSPRHAVAHARSHTCVACWNRLTRPRGPRVHTCVGTGPLRESTRARAFTIHEPLTVTWAHNAVGEYCPRVSLASGGLHGPSMYRERPQCLDRGVNRDAGPTPGQGPPPQKSAERAQLGPPHIAEPRGP